MVSSTSFSDPKPHITIIDDDDLLRGIMACYLKDDYSIADFSSGDEALTWLHDHKTDLIVSDIKMPNMNGLELRAHLGESENLEAVPFLFLTGQSNQSLQKEALALGVDDFLYKPIEKEELLSVTRRILKRAHQVKESLGRRLDKKITSALKPSLPAQIKGFKTALRTLEVETGGGDLVLHVERSIYDMVVLADVMGHGEQAKFFAHAYAGYSYGLMRAVPDMNGGSRCSDYLQCLNRSILEDPLLESSLMTCLILQTYMDGRLTIAAAGHANPHIISAKNTSEILLSGGLMGLDSKTTFPARTLSLQPFERLFLYTDGLVEVSGYPAQETQHLQDAIMLLQRYANHPIEQAADALLAHYKAQSGADIDRGDDMTFVLLERDV